jgi:hypothetical protein
MKIRYIIGLLFISCFGFGQAQELEEIIEKHIEAHGGAEKWNAIENMKITAQFTAFSEVDDWMAIKTRHGKYYSELSLGKFDVIEAFDGHHGWTIDPWADVSYPRLLNEAEENVFFQKAEWMTPFFNYKEKGLELEYLGEEDLEGVAVYTIKVTRPSGSSETWYLSKDSFLEYKRVSFWVDFTYPVEAETYFEDFRDVDGLIIPFYVEKMFSQRNRVLEIENIVFNVPVDEQIFEMPPSKEMEKLAFMLGDWDVNVEFWVARRNRWYPVGKTTSSIQWTANNLIEENIRYTISFVLPLKTLYSYHAATETYRLCRYNASSSEMKLFLGQLNDSSFVAENTNVSYGENDDNHVLGRFVINPLNQNQFVFLIQNSYDQGETWVDSQRLTYSKAALKE